MPREPAYAGKRSKDCGVQSASEGAEDRMSGANVRRRGVGNPSREPAKLECESYQRGHGQPSPPARPDCLTGKVTVGIQRSTAGGR